MSLVSHVLQSWFFATPTITRELAAGRFAWDELRGLLSIPTATVVLPCLDVPVRDQPGHWTLLVVVLPASSQQATTYVFDSLGGKPTDQHRAILHTLRQQLEHEATSQERLWQPDAIARVNSQNLQSPSVNDCGVWMLVMARSLLCGDAAFLPDITQIPGLRVVLTAEVLIGMRVPIVLHEGSFPQHMFAAQLLALVPLVSGSEVRRSCLLLFAVCVVCDAFHLCSCVAPQLPAQLSFYARPQVSDFAPDVAGWPMDPNAPVRTCALAPDVQIPKGGEGMLLRLAVRAPAQLVPRKC